MRVRLEVGPVAHGGHCVARHDGRVVFVRHTLPGEEVVARLTDAPEGGRFWRADAVEVLRPSPDRVPSVWPEAGPGGVGGGELAHVALPAQRRWKAAVVAEQLRRLAALDRAVEVEAASGDEDRAGLGYRTRIELVADGQGRAGMHRHRSHEVLALADMPLATEAVRDLDLFGRRWPAGARIEVAAPAGGDRPVVLVDGVPWSGDRPDRRPNARTSVREIVDAGGRRYGYRVAAAGFWQVHRHAPAVLVDAVLAGLRGYPAGGTDLAAGADLTGGVDLTGGTVLDLYAGAGLFAPPLAGVVGPGGRVVAVEGDARAVKDARRNAHDLPVVELHAGDVARVLRSLPAAGVDAVVLDPPRVGAGRRVVTELLRRAPAVVVYVACDPAALARDVRYLRDGGYELTSLRAFDLFPHTHHVECVAVLHRLPSGG